MLADLILIAILVLNVLLGLKRGFFEMLGRLILFLLSLAITLLLLSPLTELLIKSPFLAPLATRITDTVLKPLQQTAGNIGTAIESFNLPPMLARLMQSKLPTPDNSVTQAYSAFAEVLFRFALNAAIFIIMFAVVALVIHFLARALTRMAEKVPVAGAANHLGGLLAGLVLGLIQISILLLVLGFLVPYLPSVAKLVADSKIAGYFYAINILAYLL